MVRLALAAALMLSGVPAAAGVLVYHVHPVGADPAIRLYPHMMAENETATVDLYVVKDEGDPSVAGPICVDPGNVGGETCGFELTILAEEDFFFEGFTPADLGASDQISSMKLLDGSEVTSGDFDELRVNGTNTTGPWTSVPLRIGTLDVRSGSIQADVVVSGLHVGASSTLASASGLVIQVPEASQLAMLLPGLALLYLLQQRRSRSAAARECS